MVYIFDIKLFIDTHDGCDDCLAILTELENIDDDVNRQKISMVKTTGKIFIMKATGKIFIMKATGKITKLSNYQLTFNLTERH